MSKIRLLLLPTLLLTGLLVALPLRAAPLDAADADLVTVDEVLAEMALVPARELSVRSLREPPPGHFEHATGAREIAQAIAQAVNASAPLYGSRALTAALEVVHGAWESGFSRCIRGDSGRSWGFLQLSIEHTDRYRACDPFYAARRWIGLAANVWCARNPEGAELAAVESGHCSGAQDKARHRLEVARQIADDVAHARLARE